MLLRIYPENPNLKHIRQVVDVLENGGIVIFPTDTVYAIGCDISENKTIERLAKLKGFDPRKPNLSMIVSSISQLSEYTLIRDNNLYKLLRKNLPGPFTFIVPANNQIPKMFKNKKRTVGVRIPDNPITMELVMELGRPIVTTSVRDGVDDEIEYTTDPELIAEKFAGFADIVVDGGMGNTEPSTIVDCTEEQFRIVRQGAGIVQW